MANCDSVTWTDTLWLPADGSNRKGGTTNVHRRWELFYRFPRLMKSILKVVLDLISLDATKGDYEQLTVVFYKILCHHYLWDTTFKRHSLITANYPSEIFYIIQVAGTLYDLKLSPGTKEKSNTFLIGRKGRFKEIDVISQNFKFSTKYLPQR